MHASTAAEAVAVSAARRLARSAAGVVKAVVGAYTLVGAALFAGAAGAQPALLSQTGLFTPVTAGIPERLAPDLIAFTPQHALWSDGAAKRRWLRLPPGAVIDARDVDAWRFPRGAQLWKEFSLAGRPVETRYIEHGRDGRWRFATYAWNATGADAHLVAAAGDAAWPVPAAPNGRYALPSVADCHACHESNVVPVIGFSALQVASELQRLAATKKLRGLDVSHLASPPRIAADSEVERAALGVLHANCGHCHNRSGNRVPLPLTLAQRVADARASRAEVLASTLDAPARFRAPASAAAVIAPGRPEQSLLVQRMASRDPRLQMPPLGTVLPDPEGLALVRRWIANDLASTTATEAALAPHLHHPHHDERKPRP